MNRCSARLSGDAKIHKAQSPSADDRSSGNARVDLVAEKVPARKKVRLPPAWLTAVILVWCVVMPAQAHDSIGTVSNTVIVVNNAVIDYYMTIPKKLLPLMFATSETDYYRGYFSRTQTLESNGRGCPLTDMSPFGTLPSSDKIVHLKYRCPEPISEFVIKSEALLDIDDKHAQTVKVVNPNNLKDVLAEGILDVRHRNLHIAQVSGSSDLLLDRIGRFVALGIEHILTGFDHVLFIVSVILVTAGIREAVKLVTSFTVAHSITLALAYFDIISLPNAVVEPLIALTIIYVALENLFIRTHRFRWLLVFAFGLVHGLGFVGVLKQLTFSQNELLSSLLAFNAGIELGQLVIVIPLVVLLAILRKHQWQPMAIRYASFVTGSAGLVWFVDRIPTQYFTHVVQKVI